MDWSSGAGYGGLYTNVNKRESAKQDLATLSVLNKEIKDQKIEQEQAQLKEQAYYDQISKFADTLLGGDRTRINQKAQSMSGMVRNHLKQYGGDLTKFFENGGHRILGDYKNSIINSEEAGTLLENKKNMERILDMQSKGFGHLINPTDMYNMNNYQQKGSGKITYTGMLSEVKIPDPQSEIWGKEIKADTILHNEGNYAKFYANYKMTYPDSPEPSEKDLLAFVSSQHSDILGKNYQKPMAERKMAYDEYSDERNFKYGVTKDDKEYNYREYRDDVGDTQWNKGYDLQLRQQELAEEKALIDAYQDQGGARKSKDSATGYVDQAGNPITKEDAEATNTFLYDMDVMTSTMNNKVLSIDDISTKVSDIYKDQFGADVILDNDNGYRDDSSLGSGRNTAEYIFGTSEGLREFFNDKHRIRGSKMLLNGQSSDSELKSSGLFRYDDKGGIKIDLSQNPDLIGANGIRVKDWSSNADLSPEGRSRISGDSFANEVSKTTFKNIGIVTGFMGKDKNGVDVLITDIGDTGLNNRFAVKDKANKKWTERMYDKNSRPIHKMMVALQNEKGQVFYKPIDGNLEKAMMTKFSSVNSSKIKTSKAQAQKVANKNDESLKQSEEVYRSLKRDSAAMARIRQQVELSSGNPNTVKFDAAAISFYTHLRNATGGSMSQLIKEGKFYDMLQAATDTPEEKQKLQTLLQNPKAGSIDFVNFLIKNTEYDGGADWLKTNQFIESIKFKK